MTIQSFFKPKLTVSVLALVIALYLTVVQNTTFFKAVFAALNKTGHGNLPFETAIYASLTLLFFLLLSLLASIKPLFKPLLMVILVLAATISFFMDTYGAVIDADMIQNLMQTDVNEAIELFNLKLFLHILFLGVLPAVWVCRTEIQYQPFWPEIMRRLLVIGIAAVLLAGTVFTYYKDFSFVLRNNHSLRYLINPNYPVYSFVKYLKGSTQTQVTQVAGLGADAEENKTWQSRGRKSIVVIVVGETARAENFSLNGYAQATNPRLSKEDIINFPNTHSCGTATAVSLPCMFSNLKQSHYSDNDAKQSENLLDVLAHAGISVLWKDNNSGCKGVCQRVATENTEILNVPGLCAGGECYDEVMLQGMQSYFDKLNNDTVIVLHQKGSHGPAYYKRHPERFKVFQPECTNDQVQDCPQADIVNAYDNTILYTDYFLAEVIKLLKMNASKYNTALFYMSDHGESLGENGIYLHGLPYSFAPEEQKHIPFILWLSKDFSDSFGLDTACIKRQRTEAYTHDNLFHSVLGMLGIKTTAYQPDYDIFSNCHQAINSQAQHVTSVNSSGSLVGLKKTKDKSSTYSKLPRKG
ncbi:phosphoethanolamine--lipid A transferase [Methyloglobulus sp.]|uniref:phosphoethanolamine transferase n=1 Tax=Methyloglobulus sp. TaxID=2518622 RepID=UPI0032B87A5E